MSMSTSCSVFTRRSILRLSHGFLFHVPKMTLDSVIDRVSHAVQKHVAVNMALLAGTLSERLLRPKDTAF